MKEYVILTDVSADVEKATVEKYHLEFVPMQYSLGEEMRTCSEMEEEHILKMFYDGQRKGDLTKTSQITPYLYEQFFEPYLKKNLSILYLALSSGLSSTYNAACLAKETLKEKYPDLDIYPIDTLGATGGMGVLVETALKAKEEGLSIEENRDLLLENTKHIRHWFMVQDLMYLKRGGRVSATTAVVGSMLNIKPILRINEQGKLETISKKHGNKAALLELFNDFEKSFDESYGNVIYITHADCKELADELVSLVENKYPQLEVKQTMLSPIIGAHTGPGMVAICHYGK